MTQTPNTYPDDRRRMLFFFPLNYMITILTCPRVYEKVPLILRSSCWNPRYCCHSGVYIVYCIYPKSRSKLLNDEQCAAALNHMCFTQCCAAGRQSRAGESCHQSPCRSLPQGRKVFQAGHPGVHRAGVGRCQEAPAHHARVRQPHGHGCRVRRARLGLRLRMHVACSVAFYHKLAGVLTRRHHRAELRLGLHCTCNRTGSYGNLAISESSLALTRLERRQRRRGSCARMPCMLCTDR